MHKDILCSTSASQIYDPRYTSQNKDSHSTFFSPYLKAIGQTPWITQHVGCTILSLSLSLSLSIAKSAIQTIYFNVFLSENVNTWQKHKKPFMLSDKVHSVTNWDSKHTLLIEAASCGCVFFTGFEANHDKTWFAIGH